MSKTIVVTGGKGLIGGYLLAAENSVEWVSVVRPREDLAEGEVGIDLEKSWSPTDAGLPEKCDAVIYLAQSSAYRELPARSADLFQCNVVSLSNMLEYAQSAGATSFVNASTGSVYRPTQEVITESSPVVEDLQAGGVLYPWSKLTGEALVNSYSDHFSVTNLRFFFVYGAGGDRQMLLPRIARNVRDGETIKIQGENGVSICPTFAGDAAAVCLKATELEGAHTINVAGPESLGLKQIGEILGSSMGKTPVFESNPGDPPSFRVDESTIVELMGRPLTGFAENAATLVE